MGEEFQTRKNWLPPNVNLKDPYKDIGVQRLADKSLADCVEALIGLYLVKCGDRSARCLLKWLNYVISTQVEFLVDFKPPPSPPMSNTNEFDKLEIKLNYKFRNKSYLIQAFTHPTFINSDEKVMGSYQRLEFIGDSVLDLLVTQYLFADDENQYSPGQLTDMRQALVNNKFFAQLSIKYDLHKYLKYESKQMFNEIMIYSQGELCLYIRMIKD